MVEVPHVLHYTRRLLSWLKELGAGICVAMLDRGGGLLGHRIAAPRGRKLALDANLAILVHDVRGGHGVARLLGKATLQVPHVVCRRRHRLVFYLWLLVFSHSRYLSDTVVQLLCVRALLAHGAAALSHSLGTVPLADRATTIEQRV